ncbi:MAG TPA: TonB-dependent receptor [Bacteroidia bacterium]|jgi:outer membrane receptor protein involved in Fe transport|nr:TonB-dependent receptor [Bacteroidia bacterium]
MKRPSTHILKSLFLFLSFTAINSLFAATIKGHVKDAKNGETLIGATVYLKENTAINDATSIDGTYNLKNVQPGKYTIVIQYYSYTTMEKTVTVANATDAITEDFEIQPDSLSLKEVQVVGTYEPGSDNYARSEERQSNVIMNIMSAKTIQLLPDITIADVMQRVSGVNLIHSVNGGGKYVVIRGMDKRFVVTTINGIELPSPNNRSRSVPLDLFPAGIVERMEISKTLIPSMPGSGTAGIINLVMKDAPDRFTLDADVATGQAVSLYNNTYYKFNSSVINSQSPSQQLGETAFNSDVAKGSNAFVPASGTALFPTADFQYTSSKPIPNIYSGFTIGDRYFHDKLGVILSVDYQNTFSSTNTFFIQQAEPGYGANVSQPNLPLFEDVESRLYSTQNEREGAHLKLDYNINPKHKISIYTMYFGLTQYRSDIYSDTLYGKGARIGPGQGDVDYDNETRVDEQHIFNTALQGTDTIAKNLSFDWTGTYARAWQNTPDWGDIKSFTTVGTSAPEVDYWSGATRRWNANTDNEYTGLASLNYKMKIAGQDIIWTIGAMNQDRQRNQTYDSYKFSVTSNEVVSGTTINDQAGFDPTPGISTLQYSAITNLSSLQDPNNYSLQENINAFYIQGKVSLGSRFQVVGGIRNENTNDNYVSNQSLYEAAAYGHINYRDYLPSVEVTYLINPKMNIKASYYASITRPEFYEIVPYSITDPEGIYTDAGNPNLKRTQIDNLDLRYEYYPSSSEQILVGGFYKVLTDAIEYEFTNATATTISPENDTANKVTNYGFEIQAMKKFLRYFEVSGNYTFTQSQITVNDLTLYYNSAGQEVTNGRLNETRPLQGQAKNIGNLSLIFKNPKIGLDAQLSGVYTGKLIAQTSEYYGLDEWQMPMVKLDFSFEKRLSKKYKISLYGKVMNILNTPYQVDLIPPAAYLNNISTNKTSWIPEQSSNSGNISNIVILKETYGQSWLLGIRYKF